MILAPGEIQPITLDLASPRKSHKLGKQLLARITAMQTADELYGSESRVVSTEVLGLELKTKLEIFRMHSVYKRLLAAGGVLVDRVESQVVHGDLDWHIDTPGDVRFLRNLGPATAINLADEWDPKAYAPGDLWHDMRPARMTPLPLATGSVYVANNLVTDLSLMRPHQTPEQAGRVVLRTSCYAREGWESLAVDGGITVNLELPASA